MTSYARLEVNLIAFLGAAATTLTAWLAGWWAVLPALLMLALLAFYRDPPRRAPQGSGLLLSPADGRVIRVERAFVDPEHGGESLRIVIFLSVLNVHINRAPCAGVVTAVDYRAGRFLNALRDEATTENERNTLTLRPEEPIPGPVRVRQIAGLLARRIVCAVGPGDALRAGQRFGMIKLGSQTELRVPEGPHWSDVVRVGQRVRAGSTILARYSPPSDTPGDQ